jgi:short-subunit dehydrogenase involved in D-alanine esterification of teichoic acids
MAAVDATGRRDRLHPLRHPHLLTDGGVTERPRTDLTGDHLTRVKSHPQPQIHTVAALDTSAWAFLPKKKVPNYCATKAALHCYTQSLRFQLRNTAVQVIEIMPPGVQTGLRDERVTQTRKLVDRRA